MKRAILWLGLLGLTARVASASGTGSVSATPNPCVGTPDVMLCTTAVTLSYAGTAPTAEVWVSMDGAPETLFTCGTSGTVAAGWIQRTHAYTFTLYESTDCTITGKTGPALAVTTVRGTSPAPTFTTPAPNAILQGTLGQPLTLTMMATPNDEAITYGASGLPPGLSFVNFFGIGIQGTPTQVGSYTMTLTAANSGGTTSETVYITIGLPPKPVITSGAFPGATIGVPFSYQVTAANQPTSYAVTGLPDGLTFDAETKQITGTPTAYGTFPVTLAATNIGGTGQTTLPLTVQNAPPSITSALSATGIVGQFFYYQITATHHPLTFAAIGLPPGLSFDAQRGVIYGYVPYSYGWQVQVSATNDAGTANGTLYISIYPPAPVITGPFNATAQAGVPFMLQMRASHPGTYSASGLPPGLSIGSSGLISGTPTVAGTSTATVVSTSGSGSGSAKVTIVVSPATVQALAITQQPAGATVSVGQSATFVVVATGTVPLTYQWLKNGAPLNGATAASYTTPATALTDNGSLFAVRVTNAANQSVTSSSATLIVNAPQPPVNPPIVNDQPPSIVHAPVSQIVTVGQTATFSVTANGTLPLTYQWTKNGAAIPGATGASYTTPPTTLTDDQAQFAVTVNNDTDSPAVGGPATLSVHAAAKPTILSVTSTPNPVTAKQATLQVIAQDAGGADHLAYAWTATPADLTQFTGANTATPTAVFAHSGATVFHVTVQNAQGQTAAGDVTVNALSTLTAIFVNPPLVPKVTGTPYTFTVTTADQWNQTISPAPAVTWSAPGASIVNGVFTAAKPGVYTVSASANGLTGYVTVTVSQASAQPAVLTVGSVSGAAGSVVTVPVTLTPSPDADVAGLQFSVAVPAGLTLTDVTVGDAARNAGKSVVTGTNHAPVLIFGGTHVMGAGVVANLQFQVASNASGVLPVTLSQTSGTMPSGVTVAVIGHAGTVTASGALAVPSLSLPASLALDDSLNVSYPSAMPVTFVWTITPAGAAPAARLAGASSDARTIRGGSRLPLAALNLAPGRYVISVVAVDTAGHQSLPAHGEVTLVAAADFSAVKIYPNPWRADRPIDGIHFENLPAGSTVKIFTLSGRWVDTLTAVNGQALWPLKNDSGDDVASGLYMDLITDGQGGKTHGTLAIVK